MEPSRFRTETLSTCKHGDRVERILAAAVEAVEPGSAVRRYLQRDGSDLVVAGVRYPLGHFRRIRVVGAGKAGAPMAAATEDILGNDLTDGLVIVKEGYCEPGCSRIQFAEAGHPIPDERGVQAAGDLGKLLQDGQADDLVICLISGGGSALLVSPVTGLGLGDLQAMTAALLASGAAIQEINALRKHLEYLKGGGLARRARPARIITLVLSDVVGDPLDVIASGATVADPTTYTQAWQILERYDLLAQMPPTVTRYLQLGLDGLVPETPKPGDPLFDRVQNVIIGSNRLAAEAAAAQASKEGFSTLLLTTFLQGEARQVGRFLASLGREMMESGQPLPPPACLVAGGETTVTLIGSGKGGRNQELALSAVRDLAGLEDIVLVSLATDGGDGPTDAAGAVVSGSTLSRATSLGLDPAVFLKNNDAYPFFQALGDLIITGPTMTNVNDLTMVFSL
jgi:hydroxypyruvate reductase